MHKLQPGEYPRAQHLLEHLELHQAVRALLVGDSPGVIMVDDGNNPGSLFAETMNRFFLTGYTRNERFNQQLVNLIENTYYQQAPEIGADGFSLFYSPIEWSDVIQATILQGKFPIEDLRNYYRCRKLKNDWRSVLPDGYTIHQVDQHLLANQSLANREQLIEEIHSECSSVAEFLSDRFGYCVIWQDQLVTWCLSEYNSQGVCEVGIATIPDHQRKGLAKAACLALIEFALGNGYKEVGWHCYSHNDASNATALAVGFEKVCQYPSFWALYDETINFAVNGNIQIHRHAYQAAVEWYMKSLAGGNAPDWVYWQTACAYAHLDQRDNAFDYLNQAIHHGFTDADHIKNSPHFEKWHNTREWEALVSKL